MSSIKELIYYKYSQASSFKEHKFLSIMEEASTMFLSHRPTSVYPRTHVKKRSRLRQIELSRIYASCVSNKFLVASIDAFIPGKSLFLIADNNALR